MIHLGDLSRFDIVIGFINDFGEVSRAIQLAVSEGLLIALHDLLNTINTRVEDVAIEGEAVGTSVIIGRDRATKPIQVDQLITIVELEDIADGLYRLQVLVPLRVEEVERIVLARVTIRQGEINGKRKVNLATTKDVFEEGMCTFNFEVLKGKGALICLHLIFTVAFLELSESDCVHRCQVFVLATRDRSEEFDFYFVLYVILTEVCRSHLHLIPLEAASIWPLDL